MRGYDSYEDVEASTIVPAEGQDIPHTYLSRGIQRQDRLFKFCQSGVEDGWVIPSALGGNKKKCQHCTALSFPPSVVVIGIPGVPSRWDTGHQACRHPCQSVALISWLGTCLVSVTVHRSLHRCPCPSLIAATRKRPLVRLL
jgi:hypothetical protein